MPRQKGEYHVPNDPDKYGNLAGRTFPSYSRFETERAHEEGYSSIKKRQEIQKLEDYQSQKELFTERHPEEDITSFNRDYERLWEAEEAAQEAEEDEERLTKVDVFIARLQVSARLSKQSNMSYRRALISYLGKKGDQISADRPLNEYSNEQLEGFLWEVDELVD